MYSENILRFLYSSNALTQLRKSLAFRDELILSFFFLEWSVLKSKLLKATLRPFGNTDAFANIFLAFL